MNSESDKFDAVVGKVFSVPRAEIVKREKEYQRRVPHFSRSLREVGC